MTARPFPDKTHTGLTPADCPTCQREMAKQARVDAAHAQGAAARAEARALTTSPANDPHAALIEAARDALDVLLDLSDPEPLPAATALRDALRAYE